LSIHFCNSFLKTCYMSSMLSTWIENKSFHKTDCMYALLQTGIISLGKCIFFWWLFARGIYLDHLVLNVFMLFLVVVDFRAAVIYTVSDSLFCCKVMLMFLQEFAAKPLNHFWRRTLIFVIIITYNYGMLSLFAVIFLSKSKS